MTDRQNLTAPGRFYFLVAWLLRPVAWWGRMRVEGLEAVPRDGPLLIVPNHDSQWDPILVGVAMRRRRRLRFLSRADLWRLAVFGSALGRILNALGQIPIERGAGDERALAAAIETLRGGEAICIFPEGRLSRGEHLRARTGVARLAAGCPRATVVLCAVSGTTGYVRFPRRPRVEVSFFTPAGGQPLRDESPQGLAARLLDQLRQRVPPQAAGRRRAA